MKQLNAPILAVFKKLLACFYFTKFGEKHVFPKFDEKIGSLIWTTLVKMGLILCHFFFKFKFDDIIGEELEKFDQIYIPLTSVHTKQVKLKEIRNFNESLRRGVTWIRGFSSWQVSFKPLDSEGHWKVDVTRQEEPELVTAHRYLIGFKRLDWP